MKILFNIINRFISTKPKPPMYGRWHLDYERSIQDRKVYLTNMDNCGCCGNIIEEIKSKFDNIDKNDEYTKTYTDEDLIPYFL
jgi:hypothetical protein